MEVKQRIRQFLGKFLDVNNVKDDDNIFRNGLVNSLFAMQLVSFIEKEFDLSIENEELDLENFKDVNSITSLILSKMQ